MLHRRSSEVVPTLHSAPPQTRLLAHHQLRTNVSEMCCKHITLQFRKMKHYLKITVFWDVTMHFLVQSYLSTKPSKPCKSTILITKGAYQLSLLSLYKWRFFLMHSVILYWPICLLDPWQWYSNSILGLEHAHETLSIKEQNSGEKEGGEENGISKCTMKTEVTIHWGGYWTKETENAWKWTAGENTWSEKHRFYPVLHYVISCYDNTEKEVNM